MADDSCVGFKRTIAEVEEDAHQQEEEDYKESSVIVSSPKQERQISPKKVKSSSFENSGDTLEHSTVNLVSVSNDQEMLGHMSQNVEDFSVQLNEGDILDAMCENEETFGEVVMDKNISQKGCETNFEWKEEVNCPVEELVDENKNPVGEVEMASVIECGDGITSNLCFDANMQFNDEPIELENILEAKKKELLAQIEAGSVFGDVNKVTSFASHFEIDGNQNGCREMHEEVQNEAYGPEVIGFAKRRENKNEKQEAGGKKAKQSRRSKARAAKRRLETSQVHQNSVHFHKDGDQNKTMYSKEKMLALRFSCIVDQRENWTSMYTGLAPDLVNEYDNLVPTKKQKNANLTSKKGEIPGPLGETSTEIGDNETGNINLMDSTCDGHTGGKEVNGIREGEYYDSDDDHYNSIQRPALYVEGKPNFDSGPPEDGLEYLRRVRWEADRVPKVKVAKIDKSRSKNEQSFYMPQIPEIAKCPEHLLPLKQWEDQFLADFSRLRLDLSPFCDSGEVQLIISDLREEESPCQFPEDIFLEKFKRLTTLDPHSNLPIDEQSSISNVEKIQISEALVISNKDDTVPDYPPLSEIVKMSPVARVLMLRKRVNSLETASNLSRSDCAWLFSLCAAVDTPLDADTSASVRSLLRKCASLRAEKSEVDDETVMLNILATISGRYFGQSAEPALRGGQLSRRFGPPVTGKKKGLQFSKKKKFKIGRRKSSQFYEYQNEVTISH